VRKVSERPSGTGPSQFLLNLCPRLTQIGVQPRPRKSACSWLTWLGNLNGRAAIAEFFFVSDLTRQNTPPRQNLKKKENAPHQNIESMCFKIHNGATTESATRGGCCRVRRIVDRAGSAGHNATCHAVRWKLAHGGPLLFFFCCCRNLRRNAPCRPIKPLLQTMKSLFQETHDLSCDLFRANGGDRIPKLSIQHCLL